MLCSIPPPPFPHPLSRKKAGPEIGFFRPKNNAGFPPRRGGGAGPGFRGEGWIGPPSTPNLVSSGAPPSPAPQIPHPSSCSPPNPASSIAPPSTPNHPASAAPQIPSTPIPMILEHPKSCIIHSTPNPPTPTQHSMVPQHPKSPSIRSTPIPITPQAPQIPPSTPIPMIPQHPKSPSLPSTPNLPPLP